MTTFSMTEVCHAVMRAGITAYIEHTGGGTMTLYAGTKVGDVWTVAAGPGRYPAIIPLLEGEMDAITLGRSVDVGTRGAVGNTEAFSVGPGDMQEWVAESAFTAPPETVWICPELATVAEIADEIIHQVKTHIAAPEPVVVKTWPETDAERDAFTDWQYQVGNGDTLRGFRDWLAAEKERDVDQS